ncbi:MAG: diguanylate cyclase [Rhizobacter sp.]|nr:diguanylate cyclase [Rhizobacter sp.]
MGSAFALRLGDLVLGHDSHQRLRATQALLVVLLDLVLAAICGVGVALGLISGAAALLWTAFTLVGVLGFYALVRSGLNLRFKSDPALTLPQGVFSVLSTVLAYLMFGPMRGASLLAMAVTLVFGMFALRPRQVCGLSLFTVVLLGAAMVAAHLRWPEHYPVAQEVLHFLLAAVLLPSIAALAGQLSTMRHKLRQHRLDLEHALERIGQLAIRDELTGLYNRRHLMTLLQQEVQRAGRGGRPLTLALLDVDHFKRINDTYGHAQGDEVLKVFAATAAAALRETDLLGRWGGEEFLVMLPEADAEAAAGVLARVHERLKAARFDAIDPALRITFSAGIAAWRPGESPSAAIERADAAMYAAKQGGRNRSVVADDAQVAAPAMTVAQAARPVPSCTS